MWAQQYAAVGAPIHYLEVEPPACPDGGAVIDVAATGVCRSDWHAWRGHEAVPLPQIPGHEFSGIVAEVGAGVERFAVGDRVTVPFVNGCSRCEWCHSGHAEVCPDQTQPGFTDPGSFAEQVVVRAADFNLVRLPAEVDLVTAAALGCRFATAYHALTTQGGVEAGEWLVVYGCGGVGLSTIMVAKALGAQVAAVDVLDAALSAATAIGADATVNSGVETDPAARVRHLTGGGAAVSVDALGSARTADAALHSLRRRGRHLQIGLMGGDTHAALPWELVVGRELRVIGSHGMAAVEYPPMLQMITTGRLDPRALVGSVIDLSQAGEALMAMDRPAARPGMVVATVESAPTSVGPTD